MFPLFGMPGGTELLIVLAIVVLLFGANKLPALARSSGQAMGEFKRGREDVERDLRTDRSTPEPAASPEPAAERTATELTDAAE